MNSSKDVKPPTWYWVASWLAAVWMLAGVAAFVMDLMTDEAALAQMTAAQRELYESRPPWLLADYAIAVGFGVVGAFGLLLRKAWAVPALAVSLVAVVIQFGYMVFGMQAIERVGAAQALAFPAFIFVAGTLVLWLATKAKSPGWIVMFALITTGLFTGAIAVHGQATAWQPADEAGQGQMPIMPVHQEPHHRQVFQYGPMRIIDLQIPPGDMSWFHSHESPVFYLTVADSQTRTQILGEEWGARGRGAGAGAGAPGRGAAPAALPPRAGAPPPAAGGAPPRFRPRLFSDLSYAERAVTHRIHNNGTGLYRALGVINETAGGDEAVTEEAAGFSGKAEMSNRWFRVHRVALAPGEKTPAHQHKAPVVVLQDSAGKGIATGPMTFEFNEPGQWGFFDTAARHEIANSGSERLELIEVEIRRK